MDTERRTNDEAAIAAVFQRMSEAWGRGDAEAFGECFTEDCDYVTFNGMHLKGRPRTMEVHAAMFAGFFFRESRLEGAIVQLRFLNETTALVHSVGALVMRWQKKAPKSRRSINTNVLVKAGGAWRIAAFHNCRIRETGRIAAWLMGGS